MYVRGLKPLTVFSRIADVQRIIGQLRAIVISRNNVLTTKELEFVRDIQVMRTLTNRGMRWGIRELRKKDQSVYRISKQLHISERHARRLRKKHEDVPGYLIDQIRLQKPGRKPIPIDKDDRDMVLKAYEEMPMCAVKMEKYHDLVGIPRIPHNRIQRILDDAGISKPLGKKIKRKNWIRWERRHSNSLWHADFSEDGYGNHILAYIDDASRKIVGYGKFNNATTENALNVLYVAVKKFGKPKQIMTDHGSQFCIDEDRVYRFREELKRLGIEHIMSAVKRPQSNGKIERRFGTMDRLYKRFDSDLDRLVECYNNMPHLSLDTTPNIAYLNKMSREMMEPIMNKR